jgi:photosystem II stability/assembly factor-like uncharacterized protein
LLDLPDLSVPEFDDAQLEVMLDLAKRRSQTLRRSSHHRWIAGSVALVLVVAMGGASILGLQHARGSNSRGSHTAIGSVVAPSWKLVGDVSPSWKEDAPIGYRPGFDLTCPTTTSCYATDFLAQQVEVTHDGGASSQQSALPAAITRTTSGLACTDADTCSLLGQDSSGYSAFLTTGDGGQTWMSVPGPSQLSSSSFVATLSCSATASCVIVGYGQDGGGGPGSGSAMVTTDGGRTWSQSPLPSGFVPIGLQCFSAGGCISTGFDSSSAVTPSAAGTALYSTDGGSTWSSATVPTGTRAMTSLSCSDASHCFATSFGGADSTPSDVLITTDGGQSWSSTDTGGLPLSILTSVSCPTSSYCWASGVIVPSGTGNAISFADAQGLLASSTDQGQSWQTAQLPSDIRAVAGLSCPDTTTCFALGFDKPAFGNGSFVLLSYGG